MPFEKINVKEEIEKRKKESPEFAKEIDRLNKEYQDKKLEKNKKKIHNKEAHMQNRTLEFNISGNIFYQGKEVDLDDITNAFLDTCEDNDWEFCGITMPLVEKE